MNQSQKFSKGILISQLALVTSLIKAGVLTVKDVTNDLDDYIEIFTENYPDEEIKEPIELIKGMILKAFEKPRESDRDRLVWVADFVGEA